MAGPNCCCCVRSKKRATSHSPFRLFPISHSVFNQFELHFSHIKVSLICQSHKLSSPSPLNLIIFITEASIIRFRRELSVWDCILKCWNKKNSFSTQTSNSPSSKSGNLNSNSFSFCLFCLMAFSSLSLLRLLFPYQSHNNHLFGQCMKREYT